MTETETVSWKQPAAGGEAATGIVRFGATAAALIRATNAVDTTAALALFTPRAVIDDPSTGARFDGHAGIRDYIERFFCRLPHGDPPAVA